MSSNYTRQDIPDLKRRLPLPALMEKLGLGAHAKKGAFCPFHENTNSGSFSIWQGERGWKWKCHSTCGHGDEITFIEKHEGLSNGAAIRRFVELAGSTAAPVTTTAATSSVPSELRLPEDLHKGTREELQTVATLRGVDLVATTAMSDLGVLAFGTACGKPCWLVGDASRRVIQARRMDGKPFAAFGSLGERKTHNLKGSKPQHLVGLRLRPSDPIDGVPGLENRAEIFNQFLLVEGSGDFVAAFHFALGGSGAWLPVAALGAGIKLDDEALSMMAGKKVIIVPHIDENGTGQAAGAAWVEALRAVGCNVRLIKLAGHLKADGKPVKDLNDCVHMSADKIGKLLEAFNG